MDIFATLGRKDKGGYGKDYNFHSLDVTPGLFIEDCVNRYLKGTIPKCNLPSKSTDKIGLEQIDSPFLPQLFPYKPKLFYLPEERIFVQRIVGYREIYTKRLRREYLRFFEEGEVFFERKRTKDVGCIDWVTEVAPGGGGGWDSDELPSPVYDQSKDEDGDDEDDDDDDDDDEQEEDEKENVPSAVPKDQHLEETTELEELERQVQQQVGGPEVVQQKKVQKVKKMGKKKHGKKHRKKGLKKLGVHHHGKKHGRHLHFVDDSEGGDTADDLKKKAAQIHKAKLEKDLDYFTANANKMKNIIADISRGTSKLPSAVGSNVPISSKKKWGLPLKKAFQKKQLQQLIGAFEDDDEDQDDELTPPDAETPPHTAIEYITQHEKRNEWLELSESSTGNIIESLTKPHMPWMKKRLAHETQLLQHHLSLFYKSCKYFGRSFYYLHANFATRQIEYIVSKKKQIFFAFSTFLVWIPLCLTIQAYIDITFQSHDEGSYKNAEYGLLKKNRGLLIAVMVNMILVGVWSVLVILQDSLVITHYLNCWNLALHEMETSAISNLRNITIGNLIFCAIYCGIFGLFFLLDWPKSVRGTCGMISAMIFREVIPNLLLEDYQLLYFQLFGMFFYFYCVFGCRCLHMLMQIVATIVKNTSEMWNLKFGLTFSQFLIYDRGHLAHIRLGHSLVKLFTQHRLICGLVNIIKDSSCEYDSFAWSTIYFSSFGDAFAWPIVIFITLQMAVFTTHIVGFVFFLSRPVNDNRNEEIHVYNTSTDLHILNPRSKHHRSTAHIAHTFKAHLSPLEETVTRIFVIIYMILDFLLTTEIIAQAGQSFIDGFEFVRRQSVILCRTSHQRRLIQSLEWSMSAVNPNVLSVRQFFSLHRTIIFSAVTSAFVYFSLIIQIKTNLVPLYIIEFTRNCSPDEVTDRQGFCQHKTRFTCSTLTFNLSDF